VQPVVTERSARFPDGAQGVKRLAHWRHVAIAACEQCGRNRVPPIHAPVALPHWLRAQHGAAADGLRRVLSLEPSAQPLSPSAQERSAITLLSGPEGGLSPAEEAAARSAGFVPATLGPRVLRADTAPLAALSRCAE
jgi:16S rRNA (uracil1498-N3)-methyltransferase